MAESNLGVSELASRLLNQTNAGWNEHQRRVKHYSNMYDVYRGNAGSGGMPWQSKLRVKYAMQVIDTALVNITSGRPKVKVSPRQPQYERGAKAMGRVLDYYITKDHFVEKQPVFAQSALIYGAAVAKNHWVTQKCERSMRIPTETSAGVMLMPQKVKYTDYDGPTFEPWDVFNTYWDPDGRDVDSAAYWVLISYLSKDQLERQRFNADTRLGTLHNLDELYEAGFRKPDNESSRDSSDKNKDKFEVQEIWRETPQGLRCTVLGNRQIVLRDEQSPYWHGKKPIVFAKSRIDLHEIAGVSEAELVDHLQQALWTVQNMRMDNLHLTVHRGITYREGGVTDPNALELRPRFKWPVTDHDDIRPFEVQPLPPEAYNEEEKLLSNMQLVTGINPYVSGADASALDQNTATGITALQDVASRLLRFKAGQLNNAYMRTYEQWSDMIQQLMDSDIAHRLEGPGGEIQWENYTPEDVVGDFDITLEGSEESLSKQQERGDAIALLNAFAPLADRVNLQPVIERVAAAYGFGSPAALQLPQQQGAPAAPNGGPAAGGQGALPDGRALDPRIAGMINGPSR